jgi:hypothetical protein
MSESQPGRTETPPNEDLQRYDDLFAVTRSRWPESRELQFELTRSSSFKVGILPLAIEPPALAALMPLSASDDRPPLRLQRGNPNVTEGTSDQWHGKLLGLTLCLTKKCRELADRNTFLVVSVSFASRLTSRTTLYGGRFDLTAADSTPNQKGPKRLM